MKSLSSQLPLWLHMLILRYDTTYTCCLSYMHCYEQVTTSCRDSSAYIGTLDFRFLFWKYHCFALVCGVFQVTFYVFMLYSSAGLLSEKERIQWHVHKMKNEFKVYNEILRFLTIVNSKLPLCDEWLIQFKIYTCTL